MHDLDKARQIHAEITRGIKHESETREWAKNKLQNSKSKLHGDTDRKKAKDLR